MSQVNLMKTDIRETADTYLLDIEIPGCKKEDIEIYVKNKELYVKVNKLKNMTGKVLKRECFNGEYTRTYGLGDIQNVDGHLSAKVENCMLTITIDKIAYKKDKTFVTIE